MPASPAVLDPEPVKATSKPERNPAADGTWFGWEKVWKDQQSAYYVQRGSHRSVRVTTRSSHWIMGAGVSGKTLVYARAQPVQAGPPLAVFGDVYLYNLSTHHRSRLSRPVNTRRSEFGPSLSGRWLLFARRWQDTVQSEQTRLLLFNRGTGTIRWLASAVSDRSCLRGAVAWNLNGPYAVWTKADRCVDPAVYKIVVYHAPSRTRSYIDGFSEWVEPAVSADGTVYFIKKGSDGIDELIKQPPGGEPEVLLTSDASLGSLVVDDRSKARHIYYTVDYTVDYADIYKIIDPTAPALP